MLGKDLCPSLKENGYDVIETDVNNLDITDIEQVISFLKKERPEKYREAYHNRLAVIRDEQWKEAMDEARNKTKNRKK